MCRQISGSRCSRWMAVLIQQYVGGTSLVAGRYERLDSIESFKDACKIRSFWRKAQRSKHYFIFDQPGIFLVNSALRMSYDKRKERIWKNLRKLLHTYPDMELRSLSRVMQLWRRKKMLYIWYVVSWKDQLQSKSSMAGMSRSAIDAALKIFCFCIKRWRIFVS